ncbi:MAG: imidazole glycerol phosphate synthase subunit HisH [Candidatus Thorarchaeota archaeon SMTZ-45]|nr:MAG: imidazole glycerol phosphate synthase subunit HisH [Candidatus Thorarchaeota archaeon SMTZ-45]KXH74234.1 MAG: imidazole glycerol phosphate synthase subunit HisH [Candidatus Thorarchaeota archaeon SMTZ1-45]
MITIIDFGMGNLGSILNMLERMDYKAEITSDLETIENAEKLILPGVGAFDLAMTNLQTQKMIPVLNRLVLENRVPILGICLGMQILSRKSEEGVLEGLSWIEADTFRFRFDNEQSLRIPHMGWNTIHTAQDSCLFEGMYEEARFYFVHSYHVKCSNEENVLATTDYGITFTSSVIRDNIYGVQFHPEKSHKFGMKLLGNFVELC